MIDYSKKYKEHLFTIFLIGGVFGIIDMGNFSFGYFIGSGLAFIGFCAPLGYVLNFILSKVLPNEIDQDDNLIDSELEDSKDKVLENKIKNKLKPFKYGIYIALLFFLLTLVDKFI